MTRHMLNRRALLAAVAAGLGQRALARAPGSSLIPLARPDWPEGSPKTTGVRRDVVAEIGLPGRTAFAVADARTGALLDVENPLVALPTASVAKR